MTQRRQTSARRGSRKTAADGDAPPPPAAAVSVEMEQQPDRHEASPASAALRRLPPLNALRAFEVAARHLSFTRAAAELYVTPAAVGQQVRLLEDFMGVQLFRRENRALILTQAGRACLPGIREGFEHLVGAVSQIDASRGQGRLHLSVAPSFAAKWLLPRLPDFESRHPEIDIHVDASMPLVNLNDGNIDLAICYGPGHYPGFAVERLLTEEVFPVCSPRLLAGGKPLRTPADLCDHTLLHDDSPDDDESCPTWRMWLRTAGVDGIDTSRGPRFSQSSFVVEAAALGAGVALAKAAIAAVDLAAGRLVRPFQPGTPVAFAYYLVHLETKASWPKVVAFRDWLREQASDCAPAA